MSHRKPHAAPAPVFSNIHLVDPLPGIEMLDSRDMDEALVVEALRRGASTLDLIRLLNEWKARRTRTSPRPAFGFLHGRLMLDIDPDLADLADADLMRRSEE